MKVHCLPLLAGIVLAVALVASGCQPMRQRDQLTSAADVRKATSRCASLGYAPGTDANAACVLDGDHETAYERERRRSNEQVCLAANANWGKASTGERIAESLLVFGKPIPNARCVR